MNIWICAVYIIDFKIVQLLEKASSFKGAWIAYSVLPIALLHAVC